MNNEFEIVLSQVDLAVGRAAHQEAISPVRSCRVFHSEEKPKSQNRPGRRPPNGAPAARRRFGQTSPGVQSLF